MVVTPSEAPAAVTVERRRPGVTLLVALLCWVPYAVGLVLPYYANGVHQRGDQPIYAYELATLWPYDTPIGGVVGFIALVGLPTAPFVATAVGMWSVFMVWAWWRTLALREVVLYLAAALVAFASIAWLATPLASELIMWLLD